MPKTNEVVPTVSAVDPRQMLISAADAQIIAAQARNRELAAMRKQLDRETEANEETIRIANASIDEARVSLQRSAELALTETV